MHLDEIFVINMDRDTQRLEQFDMMMKRCNLGYTRFPAINPNQLTAEQQTLKEQYVSKHHGLRNVGEIGCTLSHLSLWKMMLDRHYDHILIFEDDARTVNPSPHILDAVYEFYDYLEKEKKEEPDVLYLGKCCDYCLQMERVHNDVFLSQRPYCNHAYIMTRKGAEKLLNMGQFEKIQDVEIARAIKRKEITVMVFHPSIFFQDVIGNKSSLRGISWAMRNTIDCDDVYTESSLLWIWAAVICVLLVLVLIGLLIWRW